MNPITDVTLENGKINLFTKKFKNDKMTPDSDIKCQPQDVRASDV